jgi:hypothetical protein
MKITIIIEDQYVEEARERVKTTFKDISTLKIPLSPTGQDPVTHWMCSLDVTEEGFKKIVKLKKNSVMKNCSASVLLKEMDLKIIK